MTRRPTRKVTVASVAVLTACASFAATAAANAAAGATGGSAIVAAKVATPWLQLSAGSGVDISSQPRVVRWHGKLLVAWPQEQSDLLHESLNTRLLLPNGKLGGSVNTALTWSSISADPAVLLLGGVPTIAFGGLRSLDTFDAYSGEAAYVQSPDASSWTLGQGSLTYSKSAYGDYGMGVVDDGTGQPVTAGAYSSTDHVTVHHGIDPSAPATTPDFDVAATPGDVQNVNVARDSKSGITWALWYDSTSSAGQGIRAAQIWPTLGTPLPPAPLSVVPFEGAPESINDLQDVGVASRVGGGVWAVYGSGYPATHKLVLWHVGTSTKLTLSTTGEAQYAGVSAAPGGRLWVWWIEGSTLHAVRTNPSVTRWGVERVIDSPHGAGEAPTHTAGDGSLGPLDAVLLVASKPLVKGGNDAPEIFSTRLLEGLHVAVSPATVSYAHGGSVVVTVTDAGVPVSGARVKVGSVVAHTNASGKASFAVATHATKGSHTVSVTDAGWWPGSSDFRVG